MAFVYKYLLVVVLWMAPRLLLKSSQAQSLIHSNILLPSYIPIFNPSHCDICLFINSQTYTDNRCTDKNPLASLWCFGLHFEKIPLFTHAMACMLGDGDSCLWRTAVWADDERFEPDPAERMPFAGGREEMRVTSLWVRRAPPHPIRAYQ